MLLGRQLEEASKIVSDLALKIPSRISILEKEIKLCDEETSDLLHLAEIVDFNASEGFSRVYKDIQITRRKRREFKDELDLLHKIDKRITKNNSLKIHGDLVVRDVIKHNNHLSTRKYHPRVRKDLTHWFNRK